MVELHDLHLTSTDEQRIFSFTLSKLQAKLFPLLALQLHYSKNTIMSTDGECLRTLQIVYAFPWHWCNYWLHISWVRNPRGTFLSTRLVGKLIHVIHLPFAFALHLLRDSFLIHGAWKLPSILQPHSSYCSIFRHNKLVLMSFIQINSWDMDKHVHILSNCNQIILFCLYVFCLRLG